MKCLYECGEKEIQDLEDKLRKEFEYTKLEDGDEIHLEPHLVKIEVSSNPVIVLYVNVQEGGFEYSLTADLSNNEEEHAVKMLARLKEIIVNDEPHLHEGKWLEDLEKCLAHAQYGYVRIGYTILCDG
jgi:hypothetical protein